MGEEKPAEEKKPAAAEGGIKEDAPPPPQEIVLKVFMHCEGCARKVHRCLKGFEGVEEVITDCKTSKVVVKGEKAVPAKVLERVQRKCHRRVELVSPIPNPPQKPPEKEVVKAEEEKKEEPCVITVVLGVYMHCDACAQEITKRILRMKGVESAEANLARSEVSVKGVVEPTALADYVYKKTGKHAAIVKVEPGKKEEEKPKEEKKAEEAESKKAEEDGKENKENSSEVAAAKTEEEEDLKMEVRKNEMYYYYRQQRFDVQEINAFSDENPNACAVM